MVHKERERETHDRERGELRGESGSDWPHEREGNRGFNYPIIVNHP